MCPLLVSHCTDCASLAYLAVLSLGGHITGLAANPYYLLCEVPGKSFGLITGSANWIEGSCVLESTSELIYCELVL